MEAGLVVMSQTSQPAPEKGVSASNTWRESRTRLRQEGGVRAVVLAGTLEASHHGGPQRGDPDCMAPQI